MADQVFLNDAIITSLFGGSTDCVVNNNCSNPDTNFINNTLGGFASFEQANKDSLEFYAIFVANHPEVLQSTTARNNVLNAYAAKLYPNLKTSVTIETPFGGKTAQPLDNEKTRFIAKLNNGLQSFKNVVIVPLMSGSTDTLDESRYEYVLSFLSTTTTTTSAGSITESSTGQNPIENPSNQGAEPQVCVENNPYRPVCNVDVQTPTVYDTRGLLGTQETAGNAEIVETSASTSRVQPRLTSVNSWVISWEPTQKIGIVKVPLSKLLTALGDTASANNVNKLEFYNDTLLFNVDELVDFKSVNRRIFLPLASNRMVILKEFSVARKNIQQVEITHGSKYFQVFTESFPEFSLQIEAVKFADIAKKVKLFFDNVMKRISESNRYSGSLYIYDVMAEKIPSFELSELMKYLENGELVRYRLLPRSVRMVASAEDPNMLKITVDGIIVEWERQKARFNIPKITTAPKDDKADTNKPQLIGKNAQYASTLKEQIFVAQAASERPPENAVVVIGNVIIRRTGNTLYKVKDPTVQNAFANQSRSLWYLDLYIKDFATSQYFLPDYETVFSPGTMHEIYLDTAGIYLELLTYLSTNASTDINPLGVLLDNSNYYNNVISKAINQIGVPTEQQARFRRGFERFAAREAIRKSSDPNNKLIALLTSFGVNISID